jgi:hypothetical protein
VLAHQRRIDMGAAYDALTAIAGDRRLSVAEAADAVLESARRGEVL